MVEGGDLLFESAEEMRAVTSGQICAVYDGRVCLGGGRIKSI